MVFSNLSWRLPDYGQHIAFFQFYLFKITFLGLSNKKRLLNFQSPLLNFGNIMNGQNGLFIAQVKVESCKNWRVRIQNTKYDETVERLGRGGHEIALRFLSLFYSAQSVTLKRLFALNLIQSMLQCLIFYRNM